MDPNEVRLQQMRAQQTAASPAHSASDSVVTPPANRSHGGDMDPNDVRLRQTRMQQTQGSSPATGRLEPNVAGASYRGNPTPQTHAQSAQYGYGGSPHLAPSHPPSGYNGHQSPQSTPSAQSEQYSSTWNRNHQPAQPIPPQQFPPSLQPGFPIQVGYYPSMKCNDLTFKGYCESSVDEHLISSESSNISRRSSWSIFPQY